MTVPAIVINVIHCCLSVHAEEMITGRPTMKRFTERSLTQPNASYMSLIRYIHKIKKYNL